MKRRTLTALFLATTLSACADRDPASTEPLTAPVFALTESAGNFGTHMSRAEESHDQPTTAQGQVIFQLSEDGTELSYRVILANIENVTMSHIHLGAPGVTGPAVLWLYPSSQQPQLIPGRSQGTLGEGVATAADLVGPLAGQPLSALVEAIRAGGAYANVHTTRLPAGEIRGQIQ